MPEPGRGTGSPVVDTYSELAREYDNEQNRSSCWGQASEEVFRLLSSSKKDRFVVDVGCGTGQALVSLADVADPEVRFVGVDPAAGMRERARSVTAGRKNIEIKDGRFEDLSAIVTPADYVFSIFAFHWTTDLEKSVSELFRVLRTGGAMDLFFIGRDNGREFIRATSPIYLKYLGPKGFLQAAGLRKQLTLEEARELFATRFDEARLTVSERYDTYYDCLEGHWGWWVRIEGQFIRIPAERRKDCDAEVRRALAGLDTERGIPYTLHTLHVRLSQD